MNPWEDFPDSCMYETQTQSKRYRQNTKALDIFFTDELYNEINKKHFKQFYAGKPTKKYLRIQAKIERQERMPLDELEKLLLS